MLMAEKFLQLNRKIIGNLFHVPLLIVSPIICKQC